jgi:hypothetical protein
MKKTIVMVCIIFVSSILHNKILAQVNLNPKQIIFTTKLDKKVFKQNDPLKLTLTIRNENSEEFVLERKRTSIFTDVDIILLDKNDKSIEIKEDVKKLKNPDFYSMEMLFMNKNQQLTWQIDDLKDYFKDIGIGKYKLKVSRKYYLGNIEKTLFSNEISFKIVR